MHPLISAPDCSVYINIEHAYLVFLFNCSLSKMATGDRKADRRPLPLPCRNYKRCGCSRESCEDLHMCYYFLCRNCTNKDCTRSHTLGTPGNIVLLEDLGYFGPEGIEEAFTNMLRKMRGATLTVCYSYNSGVCEAADCWRMHVCHRHVLDGCPLEDCDLSHSITNGQHNLHILKAADLADEPVAILKRELAETLTKRPLIPSICRDFYKSAGCEGRCLRLHCCPAYVRGNCRHGDHCSKRHNMRDPHNQQVLLFFSCTESQVLATYEAMYATQTSGGTGGKGGGDTGAGSRSAELETPLKGGELEETETPVRPGQDADKGSPSEIGSDGNQSNRPTEVQRLIDYLEKYRQQKIEREKRRKERQGRLWRILERQDKEDREEERIRTGLQESDPQMEEREQATENSGGLEDRQQKTAAAQSRLPESGSREQQLELQVKELVEEYKRYTRDLTRLRELIRKQRQYMRCSVCRDVFEQPVTLNCSHTFCQECIESTKRSTRACPVCFRPIFVQTRCFVLDKLAGSITDIEDM